MSVRHSHFQMSTLSCGADHGISYIFWKVWPRVFLWSVLEVSWPLARLMPRLTLSIWPGEKFTGPKLFWPEALSYLACASSKLCKIICCRKTQAWNLFSFREEGDAHDCALCLLRLLWNCCNFLFWIIWIVMCLVFADPSEKKNCLYNQKDKLKKIKLKSLLSVFDKDKYKICTYH